jgi:signal transduction histidine kinase
LQVQICSGQVCSSTKPVNDLENDEKLIGYVRVSESLIQLNSTLRRLDYGLSSGIVISLLLSTVGGIWLTRRAMQPIELSFERLKQFTADASHELRSPLMAIKTNATVALKYSAGMRESDLEKFSAIASASNQMTQLTENLLLLARTDQGAAIATKPVNLSLVLEDLMQLYETQAQQKKLVWQGQIEEDLYLLGDEGLLKQLFTNLLQNALNYNSAGGSITVKATRENSQLLVKVKDTGVGIAPEHLNKIFERFWRVDQSRSYQSGRAGLGLAIVREIVRQHQGTIFVESQLGIGSCFTIRFVV